MRERHSSWILGLGNNSWILGYPAPEETVHQSDILLNGFFAFLSILHSDPDLSSELAQSRSIDYSRTSETATDRERMNDLQSVKKCNAYSYSSQ